MTSVSEKDTYMKTSSLTFTYKFSNPSFDSFKKTLLNENLNFTSKRYVTN